MKEFYAYFYKKSFVCLKPNCGGGNQSMLELAHMGIKTITPKNQGPSSLVYKNIEDIISLINQESSKIGSIQNKLIQEVKKYWINDFRWLNLDWLKSNKISK